MFNREFFIVQQCLGLILGRDLLVRSEIVYLPRQVAVFHCKRHQKGIFKVSLGNQKTDRGQEGQSDIPLTP